MLRKSGNIRSIVSPECVLNNNLYRKLFNLILHARDHVLHSILPSRSDFNYNLRPRRHNLVLAAKSLSITDRDFITRMIYKDIY